MANVPQDLRYTKEHEYVKSTGTPGVFRVGITDYAQGELGDVVFVELPKVGDQVEAHASFGTIEAVKAVSDLYAPIAGEVTAVNGDLDANPAVINNDPYEAGWMIEIRASNAAEVDGLMDTAAYQALIGD
jgi:glycine cleavage system H protein